MRGLAERLAAQTEIPIEFWGWAGDQPFQPAPPHRGLWLARFPMPEYRGAWVVAQLAMKLRARRSRVRAVHITDPGALTGFAGRRLLATVYDLIPLRQAGTWRRPIERAGYQAFLHGLRSVDMFLPISNQTGNELVELLGALDGRLLVAPPGIDPVPGAEPASAAARPYFLFLGGPNPNKNLPLLLQALALTSDLREELLIAGRWLPRQIAALEGQVESLGLSNRVRHLGYVPAPALPGLMRSATALVIPSTEEGFGLPVGEGLAAGALVAHSRIPVLRETSAGSALTFDPHSAAELAGCLREAAAKSPFSADLRRRGTERAKRLTWDLAVENVLTAYRQVLTP